MLRQSTPVFWQFIPGKGSRAKRTSILILMRYLLALSLVWIIVPVFSQNCSELAARQMELETTYEALLDSMDSLKDKKDRRAMRSELTEVEWEYGDVSFQLNQCVQYGGVIGEVVPLEERVQLEEFQNDESRPAPRLRPLNGMERGLVKRSKGTIKMLLGSALAIPLALVMPELAVIGGAFSLWGMGEMVSGSMDIIDAAESGQIQE